MIENDKGNPTISTVEAILRKFGLRLGLTMRTTTTYTPPLGQHKLVSQSPARGSSPKRTYAGQLSRVTTRKATAQTKIKDGDKDPTK
ncbi:hypothetical protein D3C81_2109410 [compost metagenome]